VPSNTGAWYVFGGAALLALIAASRRKTEDEIAAVIAVDSLASLTASDLWNPLNNQSAKPVVAGGRIGGKYLDRRSPTHIHRGVDIGAKEGAPVRAIRAGRVIDVSPNGERRGYGNAVLVEHRDGSASFYAHLLGFAPGIVNNIEVRAGDLLGYVGGTQLPKDPTKPHLHFEAHAGIVRGAGGRPIIRETEPDRYDPIEYAHSTGTRLV
jgi:murein DD-endopeptidase MepM/ murein hydrolase activator NlpD